MIPKWVALTTEIYSHVCRQGHAPSEDLAEDVSSPLGSSGGGGQSLALWLVDASLKSLPLSSCGLLPCIHTYLRVSSWDTSWDV